MAQSNQIPVLNIAQFGYTLTAKDFYSNSFEIHADQNGDKIFKPHSHDFFLCVLFTKGTGVHEIDFNTYSITPGSVFFLKPGQTHHWQFSSKPEGYIFFHTKAFYELRFLNSHLERFPFYNTNNSLATLTLNGSALEEAKDVFNAILQEYQQTKPYKYERLNSLVNLLYIALTRQSAQSVPTVDHSAGSYTKTLADFQSVLEHHFKKEHSPSFYAKELHISTKHLNRITQKVLGKTSSALIKERLILEAKRLLVHANGPLADIGLQLGFDSYAYFSKVFKAYTDQTPSAFRNKY